MDASQYAISTREAANSSGITRALATLDLIMDMRSPANIQISTDGKQVVFVVYERVPGEQKRRGRIWAAETDGSKDARPITSGKRGEMSPCWSPDGKKLAFVTQPEGEKEKPQLHVIPLESGEPELVL